MDLLTLYLVLLLRAFTQQQPMQPPALSEIKAFVSQVNGNSKLERLYINYNGKWGDRLGRDTIFFVHGTDFGCSAIVSYAGNKLVKVKEIVRTSSQMDVYQYYFKDNQLAFAEAKTILCRFGSESPRIRYSEKDYLAHGTYFFINNSLLTKQERGKAFLNHNWFTSAGLGYIPISGQPKSSYGFIAWQAARYAVLFKKQ